MCNEQNTSVKTWKFTTDSIAILKGTPLFSSDSKEVCHFADNHYPVFQLVLLGRLFLFRSNIASKQWIFIVFYFPGKCWRCSAMFNLWAQITDWVDNISSSFYISPFFLPSPFFLWIILSTYLHKCHVYQFRERSAPYFCAYPEACTLPWETQNENKLCQTISLSKLIKMHGVLVCEGFLLSKVSGKAMHAGLFSFKFKCWPNTDQNMQYA